jgi:trk system potassium uptake protein TrkH
MLLVMLMFVGAAPGSTGGGIKVVRFIMLFKMAYWRLESTFRPKTVRPIRINGQVVDEEMQKTVYAFFFIYVMIFVVGCLYLSFLGLPFQTAVTAVVATLNNIGPGLEHVGAIENFQFIPDSERCSCPFAWRWAAWNSSVSASSSCLPSGSTVDTYSRSGFPATRSVFL